MPNMQAHLDGGYGTPHLQRFNRVPPPVPSRFAQSSQWNMHNVQNNGVPNQSNPMFRANDHSFNPYALAVHYAGRPKYSSEFLTLSSAMARPKHGNLIQDNIPWTGGGRSGRSGV